MHESKRHIKRFCSRRQTGEVKLFMLLGFGGWVVVYISLSEAIVFERMSSGYLCVVISSVEIQSGEDGIFTILKD